MTYKLKKSISFIFTLYLFFVLAGCHKEKTPISRTKILLGTFVTITDYDINLDNSVIDLAIESAFQAIEDIETKTNPYSSESDIGKINSNNSKTSIQINQQLQSLISSAIDISNRSNGNFDFTIWPVFKLWNFGDDSNRVPIKAEIEKQLKSVNYRNIELNSDKLIFKESSVQIDLGGIVKGFAVEAARNIMVEKGLNNFIIDAGGNLGIEWHKDIPVQIYVRHPRKDGKFWCQFPIKKSLGIATSGDYQYHFFENGKRYHHVLDPKNGYPSTTTVSCTIIAPNSTLADGLSTALFVMGPDAGSKYIESNPELEGIIIFPLNTELKTFVSSGIRESIQFLDNE